MNKTATPHYESRGQIFQHLNPAQYEELWNKYYFGKAIKSILSGYAIKCGTQKFNNNIPWYSVNTVCPHCGADMYQKALPRTSDAGKIFVTGTAKCFLCEHHSYYGLQKCKCQGCQNIFTTILEKTMKGIQGNSKTDEDCLALTLIEKAFLCAFLRAGQSEHEPKTIHPTFYTKHTRVLPRIENIEDVLLYLFEKGWLNFHQNNPRELFTIKDNCEITSWSLLQVDYTLNVCDDFSLLQDIYTFNDSFLKPCDNSVEPDKEVLVTTWKWLAEMECKEYLSYQLDSYRLNDEVSDRTVGVIRYGLDNYSVSQMFNFIWAATKDAAAFKQKEGVSQAHAVNTISGSMQRRIERSILENRVVNGFRRDFNMPQCIFADIFYDRILKIGDAGFTTVPRVIEKNVPMHEEVKNMISDLANSIKIK